jgi:hypothetical protein
MCAIASSRPSTTLMLMIGARYSSAQSASVASTSFASATPPRIARCRRVDAHFDALGGEHRADARQEGGGDRRVHQQRLGRVARAVLLRLRVVDQPDRELEIGARVDVDVAVAVEVLDHRHLRLAADAARSGPCRRAE